VATAAALALARRTIRASGRASPPSPARPAAAAALRSR
jgi:hypothetical protein